MAPRPECKNCPDCGIACSGLSEGQIQAPDTAYPHGSCKELPQTTVIYSEEKRTHQKDSGKFKKAA